MIHVYYASVGSESALALVEMIKKCGGQVEAHKQHDRDFKKVAGDLCVNWGASTAKKFGDKTAWLNKGVWFNKLDHLNKFREFGVPTVEVRQDNKAPGRWLARSLEHRDGDDLEQALGHGDYFVKFVETKVEYRAHVFQGEVLRFSEKRPSTKFLEPGEKIHGEFRIGNGWVFSDANFMGQVGPRMKKAAVDAVAALGYDFGGVDIAYQANGQPIVFEVNSAPWLGGEMQRAYAERIIRISKGA